MAFRWRQAESLRPAAGIIMVMVITDVVIMVMVITDTMDVVIMAMLTDMGMVLAATFTAAS